MSITRGSAPKDLSHNVIIDFNQNLIPKSIHLSWADKTLNLA